MSANCHRKNTSAASMRFCAPRCKKPFNPIDSCRIKNHVIHPQSPRSFTSRGAAGISRAWIQGGFKLESGVSPDCRSGTLSRPYWGNPHAHAPRVKTARDGKAGPEERQSTRQRNDTLELADGAIYGRPGKAWGHDRPQCGHESGGDCRSVPEKRKINGIQAAQTLDRLSRDALFDAYLGGHTWLLRDDPASGPIQVNDIRGFETVYVNGKPEPVSSSHPARIRIGGQSYELIGAARHAENNSTTQASGGISGELTLRAGPHSPDKFKKGTAVVHDNAPSLIRAGNHDTTEKLSAQDTLSMRLILKAMTALKHNTGIQPPFKLFLDSESMFQLYDDPQFQSLYRGQYGSDAMQRGRIVHMLGNDYIDTTESVLQPMAKDKGAEIVVRRPILVAQGALIEADFPWKQTAYQQMNSVLHVVDGVAHITRAAINRTGDVIAQTWTWIGGFAAPSDSTANRRIIPTANDAYYKRAVIIEHAS